jgi:hypothetical protein
MRMNPIRLIQTEIENGREQTFKYKNMSHMSSNLIGTFYFDFGMVSKYFSIEVLLKLMEAQIRKNRIGLHTLSSPIIFKALTRSLLSCMRLVSLIAIKVSFT